MAGERKRRQRSEDVAGSAEEGKLLRIDEVADLLGTSPAQARNMIGRGQLVKPLKVPGLGLRWRAVELLAWIKNLGGETGAVMA